MEVAEGVPRSLPFSQILFPLFLVSASNPGLGLLLTLVFVDFSCSKSSPGSAVSSQGTPGCCHIPATAVPWQWGLGTPRVPEGFGWEFMNEMEGDKFQCSHSLFRESWWKKAPGDLGSPLPRRGMENGILSGSVKCSVRLFWVI